VVAADKVVHDPSVAFGGNTDLAVRLEFTSNP